MESKEILRHRYWELDILADEWQKTSVHTLMTFIVFAKDRFNWACHNDNTFYYQIMFGNVL